MAHLRTFFNHFEDASHSVLFFSFESSVIFMSVLSFELLLVLSHLSLLSHLTMEVVHLFLAVHQFWNVCFWTQSLSSHFD